MHQLNFLKNNNCEQNQEAFKKVSQMVIFRSRVFLQRMLTQKHSQKSNVSNDQAPTDVKHLKIIYATKRTQHFFKNHF